MPHSDETRRKISETLKRMKSGKTRHDIEKELERRRKAGEIDLEEFIRLRSMAVNHAEGDITRMTPPKKTFWQTEQAKIRL